MEKEEILAQSRRENKDRDLADMALKVRAGSAAARVGLCLACALSLVASHVAGVLLSGPWVICFGMLGTQYLVRCGSTRRWTDGAVCCLCFAGAAAVFVLFLRDLAALAA